ncbi:MAG: hypothetical protein J5669_09060 [Bacteroidales bacterium]|nr:hypothetical protein [Bacteroidales bacterium]
MALKIWCEVKYTKFSRLSRCFRPARAGFTPFSCPDDCFGAARAGFRPFSCPDGGFSGKIFSFFGLFSCKGYKDLSVNDFEKMLMSDLSAQLVDVILREMQ